MDEFLVALSSLVRGVGTYRADSGIGTVLSCETSPPLGQHGTEGGIRARSADCDGCETYTDEP